MSPNTLSDVSESGQCELSVVVLQFLSGGLHPGIVRSGAPYPTVPARWDDSAAPPSLISILITITYFPQMFSLKTTVRYRTCISLTGAICLLPPLLSLAHL